MGKGVCELSSLIFIYFMVLIYFFFLTYSFYSYEGSGSIIHGFHIAVARSEDISTSRPSIPLHNLLSSIKRTDKQSLVKIEKAIEKCRDGIEEADTWQDNFKVKTYFLDIRWWYTGACGNREHYGLYITMRCVFFTVHMLLLNVLFNLNSTVKLHASTTCSLEISEISPTPLPPYAWTSFENGSRLPFSINKIVYRNIRHILTPLRDSQPRIPSRSMKDICYFGE